MENEVYRYLKETPCPQKKCSYHLATANIIYCNSFCGLIKLKLLWTLTNGYRKFHEKFVKILQ